MGNKASKASREAVEAADRRVAAASDTIAIREKELSDKKKELDASIAQSNQASAEIESLRAKSNELTLLYSALEEEQQKQLTRLRDELQQKRDETFAQQRIVESRTQERDVARRMQSKAEEKAKTLEQSTQASSGEFEVKRKELENAVDSRSKELALSQAQIDELHQKMQTAEQNSQSLTAELSTVQSRAADELAAAKLAAGKQLHDVEQAAVTALAEAKAAAADELSAAKAKATRDLSAATTAAASELSSIQASMTEEQRNRVQRDEELASTKKHLAASLAKLDKLQVNHNEAITRRSASHEAFTALKLELADAQKNYMELYTSHEQQKREVESNTATKTKLMADLVEREREIAALRQQLAASAGLGSSAPDAHVHPMSLPSGLTA